MPDGENKDGQDPNETLDKVPQDQTDDEIRSAVVEKFSLDPDNDGELIDKLVADKKEEQKKLSTAIKQKIDWRNKAKQPPAPKPEEKKPDGQQPNETKPEPAKPLNEAEILEQTVLISQEGLSLDELTELKGIAKMRGVSLAEAKKDPLWVAWKEKQDAEKKSKEAALGGSGGSPSGKKKDEEPPKDREAHKKWAMDKAKKLS